MAGDRFLADLFAFVRKPMPSAPKGPYQTGGWLLRFLAWVFAAGVAAGLIGVVANLVAWSRIGDPLPGSSGNTLVLVIVLAWVASLLLAVAVLNWTSWAYARWREADARGPAHATAIGVLLGLLGAAYVASAIDRAGAGWRAGAGVVIVGAVFLVLGIALAWLARRKDVKAAFAPA